MSELRQTNTITNGLRTFHAQLSLTRVVALQLEVHTAASVVNVVAWATCW